MAEQMTGAYNNPYKFNAKELDDETGLYYYGARYYNPRISIWYGTDPLAEKYPSLSPYAYVADNPVFYTDPDGKDIVPYLINSFRNGDVGKPRMTRGYLSNITMAAMQDFGKTAAGASFFRQFLKKGQSFAGVYAKEDGKYSNQTLQIFDYHMSDASGREKADATGATNGEKWEGQTNFEATSDSDLYLQIQLDSSGGGYESLTEIMGHESLVHGSAYDNDIITLKELGIKKFKKYQETQDGGKSVHIALRDQDLKHKGFKKYNQMRQELIKMNSNYKKVFENSQKQYKDGYKNYKK